MIGQLTGHLLSCSPGRVLLDVGGVGYDVQIPLSTFYALHGTREHPVSLQIHTHVREDALQLYGFASPPERAAFEVLIAISGVGPRLALAILSGIGVDELSRAVRDQDRGRLQKIPGVGKKTAERLLLELRDRLEPGLAAGPGPGPPPGAAVDAPPGTRTDAVSALVNLGYSEDVAGRAVDRAIEGTDELPIEQVLRQALAGLVR